MHRVMILLLLTFTINHVLAQTTTLKTTDNLVTSLNLTMGQKWAINGGVFSLIGKEIYFAYPGAYNLLILDNESQLTLQQLTITGEQTQVKQPSTLYVDSKGPEFSLDWKNAKTNKNSITIGKASSVSWSSNEESVSYISYLNGIILEEKTSINHFNANDHSLKIEATDEFGNKSSKNIQLSTDFDPPLISWKLFTPAVQQDGQWIAGETAMIAISSKDASAVESVLFNNKVINQELISATNGDTIQSTDILGNTSSTQVQWSVDNTSPSFTVNYKGENYTQKKKFKVKVNEDIFLSVKDSGIGLKYAKFQNKKRQWEELPKTFTLLSRGSYTIRIIAEDLLGNKLKTKIKFRAKK